MTICYSARSHMGKVRTRNEDNLFVNGTMLPLYTSGGTFQAEGKSSAPAIFAVCDGMGGESDGDAASRLAVETLLIHKSRIECAKPRNLIGEVQAYVNSASTSIHLKVGNRAGTTLALALVSERGIHCFNMGDSRIYYHREGSLQQITHDHTLFAERERSATWRKLWSENKTSGHKLTRCIGIGERQAAEHYPAITGDGRLLICSDGLTKMVDNTRIERLLSGYSKTADIADALIQTALEQGGHDNITVIVIDVQHLQRPRLFR